MRTFRQAGRGIAPAPVGERGTGTEPVAEHIGRQLLVVGIDGSVPSWDAFAWAAGEARRCCGCIVAVFATPLVEPAGALGVTAPLTYGAANQARDQMAEQLSAEVATRAEELGVEVRFIRKKGDAAHVLAQVAKAANADVIVVGRSAKPLHRLTGSIGRRLMLCRDLPVVVVVP